MHDPIDIVISNLFKVLALKVFAISFEKKFHGMKRQKRKQDALILKMLPKEVVDKLKSGADIAENFESATLFSSTVVGFAEVTKKCRAMEVGKLINDL